MSIVLGGENLPAIHGAFGRSSLSERMLASAGKRNAKTAVLMLEDGTTFIGASCGADGEVFGEICFNTSMEGYVEVLSDPSYAGQIVTMTYPQIGNYGVSREDLQANAPALRGLVVRSMCPEPSNWRCEESLPSFLENHGVVAIEGIDTRALVRHIRDAGAQTAILTTEDADLSSIAKKVASAPSLVGQNFVETVSCERSFELDAPINRREFTEKDPLPSSFHVVAYDCGVKRGILDGLVQAGCRLTVVPWNTPAHEVLDLSPDGVFLSNGPGDPSAVKETYDQVAQLLGKVPVFGICLGHQMVSIAAGGEIEKLKFGHRGGNHPVMNLVSGRVEITSQNHGFGLVFSSLGPIVAGDSGGYSEHEEDLRTWVERGVAPVVKTKSLGRARLTHVNLNDGTCEGVSFLDIPAFSVQYHPEANPGPTDSRYLFSAFVRLMEGREDYLDIDISKDRLSGWKFGAKSKEQTHA